MLAGRFTALFGLTDARYFAKLRTTGIGFYYAWNGIANGPVFSYRLTQNRHYIGGEFTSGGMNRRQGIAAFNAATLKLTPFHPFAQNSSGQYSVNALAIAGDTLFAGGFFTSVAQSGQWLAAVRISTASALPWVPLPNLSGLPGTVDALTVDGNTLYVGGRFNSIASNARDAGAAFRL